MVHPRRENGEQGGRSNTNDSLEEHPIVIPFQKSRSTSTSRSKSYSVRQFRDGDRASFLSLYGTVFDRDRGTRWFDWKYEENPYVDHVPIVVAEQNDTLVGCRSFFPMEMRIDGETRIAFQPCDTMVHPDHQRRGLFSRMNEYALDRYSDGTPSFFFNFPNANSKPGNLKHGWREIGTVPMYYRPQNPVAALSTLVSSRLSPSTAESDFDGTSSSSSDTDTNSNSTSTTRTTTHTTGTNTTRFPIDVFDGQSIAAVDRALGTTTAGAHRVRDRLVTTSTPGVTVERHDTPPAKTLESIYRRSIPDAAHANRTAAFYRWRLQNPTQEYVTYVARWEGTPVAALIVSPVDDYVRIVDSLPRSIDTHPNALERLLVDVLAEYSDRSFVTAFGDTLPSPLRYLFYPDTRRPLSSVIQPSTRSLLAREVGPETAVEDSTPGDWALSRLDLDTT
ncbi:GNAT family N-acetyltransferase [Halobacteria archaeon AArc-m2/3/4]|uniref:GNAT family N-acetyltransferase n=1 Tax=Natronoglomus mannanivorans TaxID=2979990 RepID=A0ABT2QJW2_9EURY|nr:GNAT family N-acetyltransferase [Halobacteria archaeon AArc-m2/3/4]